MQETREEWLERAIERLRPKFAEQNLILPEKITVAVGFPRGAKAIGQCWYPPAHADGETTSIYISPVHETPVDMLDTLGHELVHAAAGMKAGHGKEFVKACNCIGLTEGKPTSRHAGPEFRAELVDLAAELGPVPHRQITLMPGRGGGKVTKRKPWLTFASPAEPEYKVRIGPKAWMIHGEPPICPLTGDPMVRVEEDT